jgi:hypothetical protein
MRANVRVDRKSRSPERSLNVEGLLRLVVASLILSVAAIFLALR